MRWTNLSMTAEQEERLPGYSDPAVVRHFDAPEAMGVKFLEVRAKSALNRVPKQSQVPFRWTINPYRGCTHACLWCMSGDTPILMADGRTKPLQDLRVGDLIVGTERRGRYRRYVNTGVLDRWATWKPAYRITLEDGTELVASADHRFLTTRGWKHVTGAGQGRARRPHLTENDELIGTGQFAEAPEHSPDYRDGYLCGMVSDIPRSDGSTGRSFRFRLAHADFEALRRSRTYLAEDGVQTREFAFAAATTDHRAIRAIRSSSRDVVDIRRLMLSPRRPSDDWCKGFLAGIFDAEGSSRDVIRISNTDPEIIDWTTWCLRRLGFQYVVEDRRLENEIRYIRVLGGLAEKLRFLHTVDPAITRKRTIQGIALENPAKLRVRSVDRLGVVMPLYDITTGTGDFIANGVVSHNCFARPTHEYLGMNARDDFDRKIVVKVNLPELLRKELTRPSWQGEHVALGTNTDPYQWVEKRYRITRGVWEAMRDFENPCSVLTKSPLLLRDLDLFQEIAAVAPFTANLSIPTIDEKVWRQTEPHTPNPRARIEAVAELNRAGIPCGVLVAPLIPGVNDDPAQVSEIVEACADAGASHIGGICLHLRGEVRDIWFEWLEAYRPDLIPRYEQLYARGAYAPAAERERIQQLVRDARPEHIASESREAFKAKPPRQAAGRLMRGGLGDPRPRRAAEPEDDGHAIQQSLF